MPQRMTTALIRDVASVKVSELLFVAYFRVLYIVKMNRIMTLVYMKYDTTLVECERVLCTLVEWWFCFLLLVLFCIISLDMRRSMLKIPAFINQS